MIIRGKDKGETGMIKRVIRSQNRVIVEGKNLVCASNFQFYCFFFKFKFLNFVIPFVEKLEF